MNLLKKIKNNISDYLYDSSIYIKDRTFVLFSICELLALLAASIAGIFIGDPPLNILIGFGAMLVSAVPLYLCVKKGKIKFARIFMALVLVFVLRPLAFFAKGGIDNGSLIMFLMGGYYLVLVLDGKFRIIMCLTDLVIYLSCITVAYLYPGILPEYSRRNDYYNSAVQYVIGLVVLTVLITFWVKILQKEAATAGEKTKELEELNRSQSRFFSSMSHEIRTPINTVLGLNEIILRQEDISDEVRKDARNIQGAGKMLLALINDILDVSKIEAGKMDIVPVNYNVASLLSEIVNMIWLKAVEKGLKFNVDIDPEVPETLFGDEVRIKQILINLLNNAVKYTAEGSVTLHMECEFPEKEETDNVLLKINVSDTGMGIKPDALPHLFDTFKRQDEEKNRHIEGTGLGLSIVKQLVELMDGEITVNSVYGEGSVFAVAVKQGISSDKKIGDINVMSEGAGAGEKFEHSFHAPDARILIVDDNEMNLEVERKLLEGTDIAIDLALSGAEALALTLRYRYDVIFMDHLMPEMDGIVCFEHIRNQSGGLNRDIPVIVLTANAGGENIELYNNTGFNGYLVKPVSGKQLEEMLLSHLPAGKVLRSGNKEMTGNTLNTASGYIKKKPVVIGTSTMSDLPKDIVKKLQIAVSPFTVITEEGVFWDNIDLDSDELVRYMGDENRYVSSLPASEEDFVRFFSSELKKAHHIIYITLTTGSSVEYPRAAAAARTFENVTLVNSELLSSATGILVMIAARLASQGLPVDKIVEELEIAKKQIQCSFIIKTTDVMARRGNISPFVNSMLKTFWLKPMLRVKNDKMGVGRFFLGGERKCYENYIRHILSLREHPDTGFVFVTYVGLKEEELLWIEQQIRERVNFEHIIFQKASAGIASNCGAGSFGLLYLNEGLKNYNLSSLFVSENSREEEYLKNAEEIRENAEAGAGEFTEDAGEYSADKETVKEEVRELKWYETIPGLNPEAAIKNSGSEEAFLSVVKIYYDTWGMKSDELQKFYDSEDWENYTIKVHALKSSSRLVGALELGNDAEALEMAGKSGDTEFIKEHHEVLMEKYRAIKESMDPQFTVSSGDLPDIPEDILKDTYNGLLQFVDDMDYDLVKMALDSVKEYKLPEKDEKIFKELNEKLTRYDWDGLTDLLSEVNQ